MLENDDVIFDATPRAPLAAVAIAAIAAFWIDAVSPELGAAAISDGIGCVPGGAADGEAVGEGDRVADGEAVGEGDGAADGAAAAAPAAAGVASAAGDLADHGDGAAEGGAAPAAADESGLGGVAAEG